MSEQLRIILIIIVSVSIFGLVVFVLVKNYIKNKIQYLFGPQTVRKRSENDPKSVRKRVENGSKKRVENGSNLFFLTGDGSLVQKT